MRLRIMFRTKNKMKVSHFEEKRWKTVGCSKMMNSISKRKSSEAQETCSSSFSRSRPLEGSHSGSVQ